jgi:uncharacterized protein (DUF3820 family)
MVEKPPSTIWLLGDKMYTLRFSHLIGQGVKSSTEPADKSSNPPKYKAGKNECIPDAEVLLKLAKMRMPFGKYKERRLIDLPERYVVWFSQKGFPTGELGDMLRMVYEIKINGLEYLFKPLRDL